MLGTTALAHRRKNFFQLAKKRGLRWHLEAIGVQTGDDLTRDHIDLAHRIFRGARGQREVNDLWTVIKHYICPRCDGIKWNPKTQHCHKFCIPGRPRFREK